MFQSKGIKLKIKLLEKAVNPAKARNIGMNLVDNKTHFIGFFDDDILVPNNYFNTLLQLFRAHNPDVIGGPDFPPPYSSQFQLAYSFCQSEPFCTGHTFKRHQGGKKLNLNADEKELILCNLWIKAKWILKEGFNENYNRNEENYFLHIMKRDNAQIISSPDLFVFHHKKEDLSSVFRACKMSGYFRGKMFKDLGFQQSLLFLIPTLFIGYLLLTGFYFLGFSLDLDLTLPMKETIFIPLKIYITLTILHALKSMGHSFDFTGSNHWKTQFWTIILIPLIHISYGLGFIQYFLQTNFKREAS